MATKRKCNEGEPAEQEGPSSAPATTDAKETVPSTSAPDVKDDAPSSSHTQQKEDEPPKDDAPSSSHTQQKEDEPPKKFLKLRSTLFLQMPPSHEEIGIAEAQRKAQEMLEQPSCSKMLEQPSCSKMLDKLEEPPKELYGQGSSTQADSDSYEQGLVNFDGFIPDYDMPHSEEEEEECDYKPTAEELRLASLEYNVFSSPRRFEDGQGEQQYVPAEEEERKPTEEDLESAAREYDEFNPQRFFEDPYAEDENVNINITWEDLKECNRWKSWLSMFEITGNIMYLKPLEAHIAELIICLSNEAVPVDEPVVMERGYFLIMWLIRVASLGIDHPKFTHTSAVCEELLSELLKWTGENATRVSFVNNLLPQCLDLLKFNMEEDINAALTEVRFDKEKAINSIAPLKHLLHPETRNILKYLHPLFD